MRSETRATIRAWVTPITGVVFLMLAITGFLMDGHQKGLSALHQALGYSLCAIAVAHIALNWRMFFAQMKTVKAAAVLIAVCVLSSILWFGGGSRAQERQDSRANRHTRASNVVDRHEPGSRVLSAEPAREKERNAD